MHIRLRLAWSACAALAATCAQAQSPDALYARSIAATCAACHGTDGRTVETSAVPGLAGMPRDYMLRQLRAFRDGSRPATVMHQIARGFTEPQLEQIAGYFAAQKK
jgi:cytochrome subunit of sulfide dehydrogenase